MLISRERWSGRLSAGKPVGPWACLPVGTSHLPPACGELVESRGSVILSFVSLRET